MEMPAEAEASPSAYEGGGGGGKLRTSRRARRLRSSTPYDRPPIAFRNSNTGSSERNGWISKFVDPASRIITNSAARLFSSVFLKRLAAPPSTSDANLAAGHVLREENSSVDEEQRSKDGENINNRDSNGINELEQLLKQKTFTRVEFDHLTELLRSRTVDTPMEVEGRRADPSTSQPVDTWKRHGKSTTTGLENGEGTILLENVSTHKAGLSVGKQIIGEDALPTELAKAYMGSRPSKVSPSSLGTRGCTFKQDPSSLSIVPYAPKSPIVSAASRSVKHNASVPGLLDPWSITPRTRNRSALYNMSRVPYSGIGSAATVKGINSNNDGYVVPSTPPDWTQGNNSSGVSQVLKRRSSALGDDFGSGGPVRRIRQKYNMVSPPKDELPISSIQRPILSDGWKYDTSNKLATEDGHKHISNASFPSVPAQSTEMARKILQQLDKLVPSPKEKSSGQKLPVNRERSPAKLTLSMLSGRALRSTEDIESIKLQNKDTPNAILNGSNGSNFTDTCGYNSQKQDGVMDNGPTKTASVAMKLAGDVDAVKAAGPLVKSTKSGSKPEDSFVSGFDANSGVKRAFQMCAPEDYADLDDDSCSGKDASIPQSAEEQPRHSVVNQTAIVTETITIGKPLSMKDSKPIASGHMQQGIEAISGASNGPIVNAKDASPTAITPIPTLSSPCPLPSAQLLSNFNGSVPLKHETSTDMFNFVSKVADKAPSVFTSSSMTCSFSNSPGPEENTKSESRSAAVISVEGAGLDIGDKSPHEGDKHTALQNAAASGMLMSATSTASSFGASTNSSLSNGSPNSTVSISAIPPPPIFSISSSKSSSASSSSIFTPSLSAVSPPLPVGSPFKFGSSTVAAVSPGTASQLSVNSGLESSEAEPQDKESHPLNMPVLSLKQSPAFPTSGNGIFSFNSSTSAVSTTPSPASSQSQGAAFCTSNTGSVFDSTCATAAASSITPFTESASSQFGSSSSASFGLGGPAFNVTSSAFNVASSSSECSAPGAKTFGLASGFGLGSSTSTSLGAGSLGCSNAALPPSGMASSFLSSPQSASISSSEFLSVSSSPATPGFSFGASAAATSSGSVTGFSFRASAPGTSTGSTHVFSFGASSPATSSGSTAGFSFGASAPPSSGSSPGFPFGATAPPTSSGSSSGFAFGASAPTSSGSSPGFAFGASAPTSSGSSPGFAFGAAAPAATSGSKPGFPFGASAPSTSSSSSPGFSFGASAPTTFSGSTAGFPFGASTPAAASGSAPGFSFGASIPAMSSESSTPQPFGSSFGASSGSMFSFTSAASFASSQPVFGVQNAVSGFGPMSAGNDQMNEDIIAEDNQASSAPVASPVFGQPAVTPNFSFGSPAVAPSGGVFQFSSQQNPTPQASSPFSATGTLLGGGGSFSLGAGGGGDKSGRRIVKVKHKPRKK